MVDTETNAGMRPNVTPLRPADPTNAERQRRHRAKQRKRRSPVRPSPHGEQHAGVTPRPAATVAPAVTVERRGLRVVTVTVAIGLAAVAAYFSITGMTILFPGAVTAVVAMACAIEAGKLVAPRGWRTTGRRPACCCGLP
jgi:hypothetical protein